MDQSILLPNGYRIGLDPLLGLLPGVGDAIGSLISCYMLYEAARLGVRKRVLFGMFRNIIIETLVGAVPVLGDIFDATWKANMRNLRLIELNYHPTLRERSTRQIAGWMIAAVLSVLLLVGSIFFVAAQIIAQILELFFPGGV
jgi:hypothetical protein